MLLHKHTDSWLQNKFNTAFTWHFYYVFDNSYFVNKAMNQTLVIVTCINGVGLMSELLSDIKSCWLTSSSSQFLYLLSSLEFLALDPVLLSEVIFKKSTCLQSHNELNKNIQSLPVKHFYNILMSGISGFDVGRYTGTWYEYSNVFEVFQIGGTCVRATYTDNGDGSVRVFNEQIKKLWVFLIFISKTQWSCI